jgi:DNA-binding NarL/FixJ family response regulator
MCRRGSTRDGCGYRPRRRVARVSRCGYLRFIAEAVIRALVVDDHDLFRRGLRELLEEQGIRVIGEASTGADAVALASRARPDVVVMDLNLPRLSGIEATRQLAAAVPSIRVLVLTVSSDERTVLDALIAGASGYLLKDATIEEIASGVRAAAAGQSFVSPRVGHHVLGRLRGQAGTGENRTADEAKLTERELDILRLVAEGCDNDEIAERLYLSPRTVKNHVSSILAKLDMDNRVQAAVYAVRKGLA